MAIIKVCLVVLLIAQRAEFHLYDLKFLDNWTNFKATHNKNYTSSEEDFQRFKVYIRNLEVINEHNKLYEAGKVSFKMKINHFGDMFEHEMHHRSRSNQYYGSESHVMKESSLNSLGSEVEGSPPESMDWRDKGMVTGVRDQGHCGACWAFATVATLESHILIQTKSKSLLSEQNLIDCTIGNPYGNKGCKGGFLSSAYSYAQDHGIDARETYPYNEKEGKCNFKKDNTGAYIDGFGVISGDENKLKQIVGLQGPVSVAVDASSDEFTHYSKGIFDLPSDKIVLTHAVTIVGYGSEGGTDFWLIKNSWGTGWGENGYMKLARNKNMCGISESNIYPTKVNPGTYNLGDRSWANCYIVLVATVFGLLQTYLF